MTTTKPAFELEIERLIDAPIARVYKAWTDPEQLKNWFAPKPFKLGVKSVDFRVGGTYEMSMQGPNGENFPFTGTYRDIEPPTLLSWTGEFPDMPKDTIKTVIRFSEEGGKTRVRVRQTFDVLSPTAKHATAGAQQGWNMTMDQLVEFSEA